MKRVYFTGILMFVIVVLFLYQKSINQSAQSATQYIEIDEFNPSDTARITVLESPVIEHLKPHVHEAQDTVHDHGHHISFESETIMAEEDMWITGFRFILENAPSSVLHHMQLTDLDKPSRTCGHAGHLADILNIGEDTLHRTAVTFEEDQGIFIPQGHRLRMLGMLHNPEPPVGPGGEYSDVKVKLEIAHEPVLTSNRSVPLEYYLMYLDDAECTEQYTFTVPPNAVNYVQEPQGTPETDPALLRFDRAGEIVYIGGHIHGWEGGKYLEVKQNGETIRQFETVRSERPGIMWETHHGEDSIIIKAGDVLSLSAVHDNPQPVEITGPMGMVGFYFAPEVSSGTE